MSGANDKRKRIDDEVERTLQALDRLTDIEAAPGFDILVQKRLNQEKETGVSRFYQLLIGYRLAPAILAILIVINVMAAFFVVSGRDNSAYRRQLSIEAVGEEYSISGLGAFPDVSSTQEP